MAQPQSETVLDEAMDLLAQGKRFMALHDYQSATDCLEQSCQLFDAYYGVAKRECADAYLEYGLALVALANMEAGSGTDRIIKKAGIEDGNDDEDQGDEQDDEEEENEAEAEADKTPCQDSESRDSNLNSQDDGIEEKSIDNQESKPHSADNDMVTDQNDVESKTEPEPSSSKDTSSPCDNQIAGPSSDANGIGDSEDNEDNEEATTIEIAWEVLCLAKRLFMTDESYECRMKLAETLQKLGEISIEWDNNDNAVSILEECLNIRKAILEPEDRLIALTYYHLGLAYSFKSDTKNANESFTKAIDVIEKRVASLEKLVEKANQNNETTSISSYQKEINELKELIPDMTMRLDDSKEDDTKGTQAFKRTLEEQQEEDETAKKVCLDKNKPVDDISHLVKRKSN